METNKPIHFLVYGVYIVTAKAQNCMNGMTVAWVTRISHIPALVGINIQQHCFTREIIDKSNKFCINLLREGQQELARHFGYCSGREKGKFFQVNYELDSNDLPVLKDSLGYISCQVEFSHNLGDHRLYVGRILKEECFYPQEKPLVYNHPDFQNLPR